MSEEKKTKIVEMGGPRGVRKVVVVCAVLSRTEARDLFAYRPVSRYGESNFGGDEVCDDVSLLLSDRGEQCQFCRAVTRKEFLRQGLCPDCDGRTEYAK